MNDTSSITSYDVKEEENSENPKISEEIEEIKKILKNNFGNFQEVKIFCKTCKKTPIMRFDNFYKVNVSCTCGEKSFYMEEAFDKLFYDNSQNNLNKDLSLNSINVQNMVKNLNFIVKCMKKTYVIIARIFINVKRKMPIILKYLKDSNQNS